MNGQRGIWKGRRNTARFRNESALDFKVPNARALWVLESGFLWCFLIAILFPGCEVERDGTLSDNPIVHSLSEHELPFERPAPLRDFPTKHTLHVREHGAIPDDQLDDLPGLVEAIGEAIQLPGPAMVVLEPGVYDIHTEVPQTFCAVIENTENFILEGNGAEIVIHNPQVGFLQILSSGNIIVRNLSVDYDPLPFLQGIVKKVNYFSSTIELEGMEGFPSIDDLHFLTSKTWQWSIYEVKKGMLKDPNNRGRLKPGVPNTIGTLSQEPLTDNRFRVKVLPNYMKYFKKGDHYVHLARGGPPVFDSTTSEQVTFENLTVYTGPGTAYLSGGSSMVNLINCRTVIRDQRWHSTCADGIIAYRNRIGPWVESCVFEGVGDDSININTSGAVCTENINGRTFVIGGRLDHLGLRQIFSVEQGDHLRVYDPINGVLLGEGDVVSVNADPVDNTFRVKLKDEIANVVAGDDENASIFYNDNTVGANFVIRNNLFRNTRRYGVLAQSHDGVIEGNVFQGVSGNGVVLMNTIHSGSGFAPRNISIRGNLFEDCYHQQVTSRGGSHAAIIGTIIEKQGYKMAPWQGVENITIENNTVINWDNVDAIRISNGKNVRIQNNTFLSTAQNARWQWDVPYPIAIDNSTDISVLENTITDSRLKQRRFTRRGENISNLYFAGNKVN